MAELCYSQHHGSGLHFTRACIRAMDLDEIEFYLEWLQDRRSEEVKAIEKANKVRR